MLTNPNQSYIYSVWIILDGICLVHRNYSSKITQSEVLISGYLTALVYGFEEIFSFGKEPGNIGKIDMKTITAYVTPIPDYNCILVIAAPRKAKAKKITNIGAKIIQQFITKFTSSAVKELSVDSDNFNDIGHDIDLIIGIEAYYSKPKIINAASKFTKLIQQIKNGKSNNFTDTIEHLLLFYKQFPRKVKQDFLDNLNELETIILKSKNIKKAKQEQFQELIHGFRWKISMYG